MKYLAEEINFCSEIVFCKADLIIGLHLMFLGKCSNNRAYEFYAESIKNPTAFKAVKCDNSGLFSSGGCGLNAAVRMGNEKPNR